VEFLMNAATLSRWRNLGIIAHIDAGKTTLTERLLWKTGAIHRMGEVHDGAATTDFSPIERERGITIGAAAVQALWTPAGGQAHRLTLIDTPGHIDFAIEVERSLRVLDGAVAVFCAVAGVQPQSESVWRQAQRHQLPLIAFVNKLDRVGANFDAVVAQLRERLQANPWPLGLPLGHESMLHGWVDLVAQQVQEWHDDGSERRRAWSAQETARYAPLRERLVASLADHDDTLAEAWLHGRAVSTALLKAALRRATLRGAGVPVLAGSAFRTKGMDGLLDAIVDYLPSPLDRPPVHADAQSGALRLAPDPQGPLAGLVFKIVHQEHGPLSFVRLYSGTLKTGDLVWASRREQPVRVGRLLVMQADRGRDVAQAVAGDIVAVAGWKLAHSGETLSDPARRLALESIEAQAPVLSCSLGVARPGDLLRLGQGLAALAQEDPSFHVGTDAETGETLAWGMGELHLEVIVERLRREWQLDVRTGTPRVAYQETPLRAASQVEGKLSRQNGGVGQFARVVIDLQPLEGSAVEFVDRTRGGAVPRQFVAATEKGVRAALAEGPRGHAVVGLRVTLIDGETHVRDSSELAFQGAAAAAVRQALAQVGTALLEPVMRLEIHTPAAQVGEVIADLQRRQGRVAAIDAQSGYAAIAAQAPLAQLGGYATALRSLSQGRAAATQTLAGYAPVRAAAGAPQAA
jgi:elongation factor G